MAGGAILHAQDIFGECGVCHCRPRHQHNCPVEMQGIVGKRMGDGAWFCILAVAVTLPASGSWKQCDRTCARIPTFLAFSGPVVEVEVVASAGLSPSYRHVDA